MRRLGARIVLTGLVYAFAVIVVEQLIESAQPARVAPVRFQCPDLHFEELYGRLEALEARNAGAPAVEPGEAADRRKP